MGRDLPLTDISVECPLWDEAGVRRRLEQALAATLEVLNPELPREAELSVLLSDNERVRVLNRGYRGKDTPTNILSFPAKPPFLGDLVLAYETCAWEAQALDKPFNDHVTHLLVHGLLHLFGYTHDEETEAELMERHEVEILARLGLANPYENDHSLS